MKIAVAMSGGVDSSVVAITLKEQGHEIIGIMGDFSTRMVERCFGRSAVISNYESAKAIADQYKFPLHVIDLEKDFYSLIVEPFCREYLNGRTPNPCIYCNAMIKFDRMLRIAHSLGYDKMATGHYSSIKQSSEGRYYITRGKEIAQDQSYFLFMISQDSLKDMVFPLGSCKKEDVKKIAAERHLAVAQRPESQEICFIPNNRYPEFIQINSGTTPLPGNIIDANGAVIGRHRGIHRYTIGQRRGLGIASPHPLYVTRIDPGNNTIVAGHREELEMKALFANNIQYMKETNLDEKNVLVKMRSMQKPVEARLNIENDGIVVVFKENQMGISPGQAAVFYNEDMDVLGGGIIEYGVI